MKLRTVMKIAVISSVVLLCTGFVMYSYFKLSAAENRNDFDLYSLVPSTASVVFETDDMAGLVQDINELNCSKDHHFLYVSQLFSVLKTHLFTLLEETPHGLSQQMNKMLISFHEPDNDQNQVLYCSLGSGDYQLVENFIQKYSSGDYPSKIFNYKNQDIRIYPMPDGNFLAAYVTSRFLAVSYQKKLIEQVIDAHLSGRSILRDRSFDAVHRDKKRGVSATVYARMHSLDMGKMTDGIRSRASLGGWTEFDMKMKDNTIYFSGTSHDTDTCSTFMNMLRRQQPVGGFPGNVLPAGTFFFSKRSVSDLQAMFDFTAGQEYAQATYSDYIKARDEELLCYLKMNGGVEIMTCLFARVDTDSVTPPAAVMSLPMRQADEAERLLKALIQATPVEVDAPSVLPVAYASVGGNSYPLYVMPRNTLFTQLTGITESALHTYACFYNGHLLLAPDAESLALYVCCLEKGEVLGDAADFDEGASGLSEMYNFMLAADLDAVFAQPENYVRLVPSFFFRNPDFFRHFTLSAQFTCADGVISPNVILTYKGE